MGTGSLEGMHAINHARIQGDVDTSQLLRGEAIEKRLQCRLIRSAQGAEEAGIGDTATSPRKRAAGGNAAMYRYFQTGANSNAQFRHVHGYLCSPTYCQYMFRPSRRDVEDDPSIQASSFAEYRRLKRQRMAERNEWLIWGRSPSPIHEPLLDNVDKPDNKEPRGKDAREEEASPAEVEIDKEELRLFMCVQSACSALEFFLSLGPSWSMCNHSYKLARASSSGTMIILARITGNVVA